MLGTLLWVAPPRLCVGVDSGSAGRVARHQAGSPGLKSSEAAPCAEPFMGMQQLYTFQVGTVNLLASFFGKFFWCSRPLLGPSYHRRRRPKHLTRPYKHQAHAESLRSRRRPCSFASERPKLSDPAHGPQRLQTATPCRVRCIAWLGGDKFGT